MQIQKTRDRIPWSNCRTKLTTNGSQETPKCGRVGPSKEFHGSQTIPRVHRILSILHPKLLKNCTSSPRSHKKTNDVAMGTKRNGSLLSPKEVNVQKPHSYSTGF